MTETVKQELDFLDWTKKVCEIVNITHVCLMDKRKMKESDFETLRVLHDIWWEGKLPLYRTVADMTSETSAQGGLFDSPKE